MKHLHVHHHDHKPDGSCCNHDTSITKESHETHEHEHHHEASCQCATSFSGEEDDIGDIDAKYKFKLTGLDCGNCAQKVEDRLNKADFIEHAKINFTHGLAYIEPKGKLSQNDVLTRSNVLIDQVEPGAKLLGEEEQAPEQSNRERNELILSIILFFVGVIIEKTTNIHPFFIYVIPYIFAGYHVIYKSFKNIQHGEIFDEHFLMTIATLGAFVVSAYEEAVAVMVFYNIGEYFQDLAVDRTRKSITGLMDLQAEYANLVQPDKSYKQVDPKTLKINDVIAIKAGEKVPVDAIVIDGSSSLDLSALNGEVKLKDVHQNDEVLAGSLNTSGLITCKVTRVYKDSTVSKILDLVEHASNKKAPTETFITKFAKVYTPIVVGLALLLVIIPTIFVGDFYTWLYRACTFLVISCPCALVVSVPLGFYAGIGSASRIGALVKGGNYLELLEHVDTIVMDKTGTITKGEFAVESITGAKQTLELAAYAESYSNHPIAKSIASAYTGTIDATRLSSYQEIAGYGIVVSLDDKPLLVGNQKLMDKEQISYTANQSLGTVLYVAYNGQYVGSVVIGDQVKESSKQAIADMHTLGVTNTVMLTGDQKEIANAIGKEVGIENIHAELLPQDKVRILESYLDKENHAVAFVGDGINDAPALMRADVGISMGGVGSDVAIEASDIVLMSDDLLLIPKTMKIARKTKQIVIQNVVMALGIKTIVLILSAFGITNMWAGVFADVGVTLLAVLNAMRMLYYYKKV
ncbi:MULTISPECIES: heavy metal translocating P-type ATPase [unclassified Breznakia]|uniref:heavy metal translocating P-type ATPase n=1 Tax=unclassified Breznakia TaxID=2623764 RepID=UPI0024738347|nr:MULTISPECIES: heavy metal translocating P-type ATPase [unclassified Breznakia]MDH6366430.1 Cd2+/Zn2+-exporting ATPase [Breznakia sp. PH1-1]MDH6403523.1 Cd2+/Zn2+-exporting ATPase [Breznakia sp. PF1-11]MDH6411232.1 Cd2+/Zn2+-exporting ATPase [Breznakia sp. PFB1-11]MDH6413505.1 Cd2+/Zn2+-exporting ATPase [Breznakia sp. PFB1-14]MDH6415777.1 Cd2+/Zn2+-exporting ATPase [Breznakia sp. PFB1-4]